MSFLRLSSCSRLPTRRQQFAADQVAMQVVHQLEVVEIEEGQAERQLQLLAALQFALQHS